MRIDIIGAGALGLLLAGRLITAGNEVRLWCRAEEQCRELSGNGFAVGYEDGRTSLGVPAAAFTAEPVWEFTDTFLSAPGDWILITVKQNTLHHILPEYLLPLRDRKNKIVCFQNGVGHMEMLGKLLPESDLYTAVTTEAAKRETLTKVIHAGQGDTYIGEWLRDREGTAYVAQDKAAAATISLIQALTFAGFSVHLSKEVDTMIYRKLLINAVINPLTAIWRIPNGELTTSEHRLQLMKELYEEAISVYNACGIIHEVNAWENILEVCRTTSGNTSSMLADVLASRSTEIQWINGSIVNMAEQSGIAVPLHRWICRLVEGMIAEER